VPTAVFAATEDWGTAGSSGSSLTARIERAGAELAAAVSQRPAAVEADPYALAPSFGELLRGR
jgi:FMN reductase